MDPNPTEKPGFGFEILAFKYLNIIIKKKLKATDFKFSESGSDDSDPIPNKIPGSEFGDEDSICPRHLYSMIK